MTVKLSISLFVLAVMAVAAPAAAQDALGEATAAYDAGAFDRALTLYQRALEEGRHPPARLAFVHHRLGTLHAAVGQDVAARRHFELALAIDPSLAPPAELGPSRRALFEEVRAARRTAASLRVTPVEPPRPEDTRLAIEVDAMPVGAVESIRVRISPPGGAAWVEERPLSGRASTVSIPAAAWRAAERVDAEVEALDAHGSVVARASLPLVAERAAAPVEPVATVGGDVTAEPWFWAVVIGAAVVVLAVAVAVPVALATQPGDRYVLVGF